MTTQQRILITIGGCILVAMMVLGAFSLGVYVGSNRNSAAPLRRPGPGPAPGGALGQPPGPDLPRPPDIAGRIESVSGESLTLATPQGFRTVLANGDTRILHQDGSDGSRAELRPGRFVAIIGEPVANGRSFLADVIVLVEPPRNP